MNFVGIFDRQGRSGIESKGIGHPHTILSGLVVSLGMKNQQTAREVDGLIEHFERATRHSGFLILEIRCSEWPDSDGCLIVHAWIVLNNILARHL